MKKLSLLALALQLAALGCGRVWQHAPTTYIVICDVTGSIQECARRLMFQGVGHLVSTLHRGDTLILIPIIGDAEANATGRIGRFTVPAHREVYDEDLNRFGETTRLSLEEAEAAASRSPEMSTDLLGTVQLASEEIAQMPPPHRAILIVLTDGIQDDAQFNFNRDPEVRDPERARNLARKLAKERKSRLPEVTTFIGYLSSRDFARLDRKRRQAIQEFWLEYLQAIGAHPEAATDGPGLLPRFVDRMRSR